MATQFYGLPGVYTGPSLLPRNIIYNQAITQTMTNPTRGIIDGTNSRDSGSSPVSLLRAGLLMGKVTSSSKYANSIMGLTTLPVAGNQTSLTVSLPAALELVRRVGTSGTFTITGPNVTGGTVQSQTATYSAVSTTTGVVTITALEAGAISAVNAVEALPFVDSTGSGTFTLTIEGITTAAITYSSTAATLYANINTALNAVFGTSGIVASGSTLAAIILTFSGTGYSGRPIGNSSNGTVSGVKVIATLLAAATGFTAGNNPTSSGVGAALAGGSTTTTAGVTAVAANSGEYVAGSLIAPTDGSQTVLFPLLNEMGIDVNDIGGNNIDQRLDIYLKSASLISANIVCLTADDSGHNTEPAVTTWLKAALRASGGVFTFDTDNQP
jgi:hypothetical protein